MRIKMALLRAAALVSITLLAGAVDAAIVLVTYTGKATGTDDTGFFGAGTTFSDADFTLQFTLDTDTPGALTSAGILQGGDALNPLMDMLFTINARALSINLRSEPSGGHALQVNDYLGWWDNVQHNAYGQLTEGPITLYGSTNAFVASPFYEPAVVRNIVSSINHGDPLDYMPAGDDQVGGEFSFSAYDVATASYAVNATGTLAPTRVTIANTAAPVPEATTWAMMLMGFAGLGLAVRRKRAEQELLQTA